MHTTLVAHVTLITHMTSYMHTIQIKYSPLVIGASQDQSPASSARCLVFGVILLGVNSRRISAPTHVTASRKLPWEIMDMVVDVRNSGGGSLG